MYNQIVKKPDKCYGCGACIEVCPKKCVILNTFLYLKLYDTYALLIYIAYTIMFFYPNGFSFKSPSLSPGGPVEPPVSGAPPM